MLRKTEWGQETKGPPFCTTKNHPEALGILCSKRGKKGGRKQEARTLTKGERPSMTVGVRQCNEKHIATSMKKGLEEKGKRD